MVNRKVFINKDVSKAVSNLNWGKISERRDMKKQTDIIKNKETIAQNWQEKMKGTFLINLPGRKQLPILKYSDL